MPAIDFPDSPSVNDTHTVGNRVWNWNGTVWEVVRSTVPYSTGPTGPAGATGATGATGVTGSAGSTKTWQQTATGSMTGSSITVSSLTGQDIFVSWENWSSTTTAELKYRLNSNSGTNYLVQSSDTPQTEAWAFGAITAGVSSWSFAYIPAANSTIQVKTSISNLYPWSIKEPNAITSIQFFPSAGTFDAGTYYVWELK
jgi:hypothetical protein